MVVCSTRKEREGGSGNVGSVVACNNGIEAIGGGVGEETHTVVRIDGLDRCNVGETRENALLMLWYETSVFERGDDDARARDKVSRA